MAGAPSIYDQIRYVPHTFKLLFSDGTEKSIETETISKVSMENYYTSSFVPVFKVEFATDFETFFRITRDKTKVMAHFRLDYYPYTQDDTRDKKVRTAFNTKFAIYLEDDKPELHAEINEALKNEMKVGNDKTTDSATNKQFKIALFLYEQSVIDWAYGHEEGVITNSTMTDLLIYLFSKIGRKGIMSPLSNTQSYSQIFLPALTRIDLIKYLNAQYGFYNHGYNFFVDNDRFYMLNKTSKSTAWIAGDLYRKTIVSILSSDDMKRFDIGSKLVAAENSVYVNIEPSRLHFETPSIFNNVIVGNHLTTINTKNTTMGGAGFETTQRGNPYKAFKTNRYNNPYAEKEFANNLASENKVITFHTSMANRHWFTPNKEIVMKFENVKLNNIYGGSYRITDMVMVLFNSNDFLENTMIISLKK